MYKLADHELISLFKDNERVLCVCVAVSGLHIVRVCVCGELVYVV